MKRLLFFSVLIVSIFIFPFSIFSQVRIEKSATQINSDRLADSIRIANETKDLLYDSLSNYIKPDSLFILVGQRIIIKPHDRNKEPYQGFYRLNGDLYGQANLPYSRKGCSYDSLVGRAFNVIRFDKSHPRKIFIADDKDSLYMTSAADRDYLIEGYIAKLSQKYVGKKYARVVSGYDNDPNDFKTGKPVKLKVGDIWTVKRLIINPDNGEICAIMGNSLGNELSENIVGWLSFFDIRYKPKSESDKWKRKYGEFCWRKIMQNEIYVGMPASAVRLAWGEPKDINKASYGDQWVYSNGYVYIRGGKVTGWN